MLREAEGIEIFMMCRDVFPKNSRCVSKLGKKSRVLRVVKDILLLSRDCSRVTMFSKSFKLSQFYRLPLNAVIALDVIRTYNFNGHTIFVNYF